MRPRTLRGKGDTRTSFAIVRSLSGRFAQCAKPSIVKEDGTKTLNESERREAWTRHFAGVYCGQVIDSGGLQRQMAMHTDLPRIKVTPSDVEIVLDMLGNNKGVGRDLIPAEVLRAGGAGLAVAIAMIYSRVIDDIAWPLEDGSNEEWPIFGRVGLPRCSATIGIC